MNKKRIFKNIDSILQVTKETVNQSDNYYDYIINHKDTLYMRQLPLLIKNFRINALVASKTKNNFQLNSFNHKNEEKKEKEKEKDKKMKIDNYISPLKSIRNIKMRSEKLPPLCPLYNYKGELVRSIIKTSKILFKEMVKYEDNFINNINCSLGFKKMGSTQNIFINKKLDLKKMRYNKSCDFDIKLDYDESENRQFNEPEYDKLKYDESKIFHQQKLYREIIRNKINELKTVYNKNLTTKKEKIYNYGLEKIKMYLTLDSLKIKINEIEDENSPIIEKSKKIVFEYTLPLALLPLFYFRGVEQFLIILSKLITYNENNQTFEVEKKDDEIIANILKNCIDFNMDDEILNTTFKEKEINNNESNIINIQNSNSKNNINNYSNLNDNKNLSLNNSFINNQSNSSVNRNSIIANDIPNIDNNNNLSNLNMTINKVGYRESFSTTKKKLRIQTFDVYPSKINNEDKSISIYEFFWITSNKSYILTIETPLITVSVPSLNNEVKKYINFELLFYIYHNQFVMWDFYIIKYLSTYKNFRIFLEKIYSVQEKRNISFYISLPKYKKNLFSFYELTSILTREVSRKITQRESSIYNKKASNKNVEFNSNKKQYDNDNIIYEYRNSSNSIKDGTTTQNKDINQNQNLNQQNNTNNTNNTSNNNRNINKNNLYNYNSLFIQKGLLIIASYINKKEGITKEYTFHFNLDQLRKFQIMEALVDKLSFFIKFLKINYDNESISFDFESFNAFNEELWIKDMNQYYFKYLKNYKTVYEEKKIEEYKLDDVSYMKVYQGTNKNVKIKIEAKFPLILMKSLNELGYKNTEKISVNYKVEKILSNIKIYNTLDLTKQVINILKDNNFCRRGYGSQRNIRKKTNRLKKNTFKDNIFYNDN